MSNYLIVGASTGIGFETARQLTNNGNQVIALSRSKGELDKLEGCTHIPYDATGDDFPELNLETLDGFVYAPGTINLKPFHRLSSDDFRSDFEINVIGAVKTLQHVLPLLKKGTNSSVVLFSTVAVQQGMGFHSSIASSKGAIEGLTKSLAAELAPKIRVNCVAPSVTDTPLAERLLSTEEKKQASGKRHPLQRVGEATDLAKITKFLLTEESSWITGQVIGVDGGMSTLKML